MLGIEPSVSATRTQRDTDSLHPVPLENYTFCNGKISMSAPVAQQIEQLRPKKLAGGAIPSRGTLVI